ncbi:MAG: hypothetical protein ACPGNV_16985 [Mangrovicoccus sp.]
MFFELIATFVAGLGAAGLVMGIVKMSRGRLPKWLTPAAAGLAMIVFTIWSEYNWYDRTTATLPEGIEIARVGETKQFFRPWTYAAPIRDNFVAVDLVSIRENAADPDKRIANIVVMKRWAMPSQVAVLFDCTGARTAPLTEGATLSPEGAVEGATWINVPADDPVLQTACKRG